MEYSSFADDGYVVDVPYVNGYFKELAPSYLRSLLLLQQCDLPERDKDEPLRYLELGFGQGSSLSIHAVASEGEFWGTDFNPVHALTAQKNVREGKAKAQILCDSFAELAQKSKNGLLPNFDIIVLHGIWSWVNEENREYILEIIACSLKVGGLVYVSYNALPGFASFAPVRDFLSYHASSHTNSHDNSIEKLKQGYDLLKKVKEKGAHFFRANPIVDKRFDELESKNAAYLVHEYLNKNWQSFYFKDVAKDMNKAKCSFLTSARPLTGLSMALPEEIRKTIDELKDVEMAETLRDYMHNTQFRCDIFSKGKNILDAQTFINRLDSLSVVLLAEKENVKYAVSTPAGEVQCKEELYKPFIEFLASEDYTPKSVKNIRQIEEYKNIHVLLEVLLLMVGAGIIHLVEEQKEDSAKALEEQCNSLNNFIFLENLRNKQMFFMASPIIGGGIPISFMEQAFIFAMKKGSKTIDETNKYVADMIIKSGIKIQNENGELTKGDLLVYIVQNSSAFQKRLPLLKALKLV